MSLRAPTAPLIAALERLGPHDHLCSIYESRMATVVAHRRGRCSTARRLFLRRRLAEYLRAA